MSTVLQVGAQNAGKSSLINAMRRAVQRDAARRTSLTVAALPGSLRACISGLQFDCAWCNTCCLSAWAMPALQLVAVTEYARLALTRTPTAQAAGPVAQTVDKAGTTLSVLRVDGLMGQGCRMFDSPGVPHSHQLTAVLTLPEVGALYHNPALLLRCTCSKADVASMPGPGAVATYCVLSTSIAAARARMV